MDLQAISPKILLLQKNYKYVYKHTPKALEARMLRIQRCL